MDKVKANIIGYLNIFKGILKAVTDNTESFIILVLLFAVGYLFQQNNITIQENKELQDIILSDYQLSQQVESQLKHENNLLTKSLDSLRIEHKYLNND
jgi:hypothetical protein